MLFITGITGHSGRWLFKRLVQEGYKGKVRFLCRDISSKNFEETPLDIEFVKGDVEDLDMLVNSMEGVETVIHIAGITRSERIIQAAIQNNVKWVICVHTTGRFSKYKSASSDYIRIEDGILKKRNEINITVVRPTMIYGSSSDRNMFNLVDYLYRHKFFPMFGKGRNLMQPVHARDLGNAYYDILMRPEVTANKEYNLSGKDPLPYIEIVRIVSRILGRNTIVIKFPIWFSVLATKIYGTLSSNPKINVEQVLRMQEDKNYSYEQASEDFGYSPVSFQKGIRDEIEEYRHRTK